MKVLPVTWYNPAYQYNHQHMGTLRRLPAAPRAWPWCDPHLTSKHGLLSRVWRQPSIIMSLNVFISLFIFLKKKKRNIWHTKVWNISKNYQDCSAIYSQGCHIIYCSLSRMSRTHKKKNNLLLMTYHKAAELVKTC